MRFGEGRMCWEWGNKVAEGTRVLEGVLDNQE